MEGGKEGGERTKASPNSHLRVPMKMMRALSSLDRVLGSPNLREGRREDGEEGEGVGSHVWNLFVLSL